MRGRGILLLFLLVSVSLNTSQSNPAEIEGNSIIEDNLGKLIAKLLYTISNLDNSSFYLPNNLLFGQVDMNQTELIIQNISELNGTFDMIKMKRIAEILSYDSDLLNESLIYALANSDLNSYAIPKSRDEAFNIWDFMIFHGYRYANSRNMTTLWNTTLAEEGLRRCYNVYNRSFWECYAELGQSNAFYGTRWMNTANLAKSLLLLYEAGNSTSALELAFTQWDQLNEHYWSEIDEMYYYSRTWLIWEWSTIEVVYNYYQLLLLNGTLNNSERLVTDLENRYLSDSWESILWRSGLILHYHQSPQRRVRGTLDAWHMLHNFYENFTDSNKLNMRMMLEGNGQYSPPAWERILESDGLVFDPVAYRFKIDSDKDYSDSGTIDAATLLFMLGISPQDGPGLALTRDSEGYSGGIFQETNYRFLYSQRIVTVPVRENSTLKFMYGNEDPTYHFENEGTYKIQFDDGWNNILNVSEITYEEILKLPLEPNYNFTIIPQTTPSVTTTSASTSSTTDATTGTSMESTHTSDTMTSDTTSSQSTMGSSSTLSDSSTQSTIDTKGTEGTILNSSDEVSSTNNARFQFTFVLLCIVPLFVVRYFRNFED